MSVGITTRIFMHFMALGGAREIGASCGLLSVAGHNVLIDAGVRQITRSVQSRVPRFDLLDGIALDAILITHAHTDHIGSLPVVVSRYPQVPIFATAGTKALMRILLVDSLRIMANQRRNVEDDVPMYSAEQVEAVLNRVQVIDFCAAFTPIPTDPTIVVQFIPAGHILGAAMIYIATGQGSLLISGDVSLSDQRTIAGINLAHVPQADFMICEGTYGERIHRDRRDQEQQLMLLIHDVVRQGGRVLLPTFAVGCAQDLILMLKAARAAGLLAQVPVVIDGMVRSVCDCYQGFAQDLHPHVREQRITSSRPLFDDAAQYIFRADAQLRERLLKQSDPVIVISTSGMLRGGWSPIYAAAFVHSPQNAIIFTGLQDGESHGSILLQAKSGDVVSLDGRPIRLQCRVERFALSCHADAAEIAQLVQHVNPRRVVLVHGMPAALTALSRRLDDRAVVAPDVGISLDLLRPVRWRSSIQSSDRHGARSRMDRHYRRPLTRLDQDRPPTAADLYWAIYGNGARQHLWTASAICRTYYGPDASEQQQEWVLQALSRCLPYFEPVDRDSNVHYRFQSKEDVLRVRSLFRSIQRLQPGDIVLVQLDVELEPKIALVTERAAKGRVRLVVEGNVEHVFPINIIHLIPGVKSIDLLSADAQTIHSGFAVWRKAIGREPVDLIRLWGDAQQQRQSFAELRRAFPTPLTRIALGVALLQWGHFLWTRKDDLWVPRPFDRLGFPLQRMVKQHLALVRAGDVPVRGADGTKGMLTGRGHWDHVEVRWENHRGTCFTPDRDVSLEPVVVEHPQSTRA